MDGWMDAWIFLQYKSSDLSELDPNLFETLIVFLEDVLKVNCAKKS